MTLVGHLSAMSIIIGLITPSVAFFSVRACVNLKELNPAYEEATVVL